MLPIVHQPDHHQHQGQYQNPEKENKRALIITCMICYTEIHVKL